MKKIILTLSLVIFSISSQQAQFCDLPYQIDYLHTNNVRAAILNGGDNFWNINDARFQVPYKGFNSPSSIFSSALWLTGFDEDGNLSGSALDYKTSEECAYSSGPIVSSSNDKVGQNWNQIFSVHQQDILTHIEDAKDGKVDNPIPSIFGWPSAENKYFKDIHGFPLEIKDGAYFHEQPGSINGIYEPNLGEYPHIEGMDTKTIPGEIKWCVFNNNEQANLPKGVIPMGFEIQQTAYALSCDDEILSNSVFICYKIINKSGQDYEDLTMAQWVDYDLGCYEDDYIGCSPKHNTSYVYNSSNKDAPCSRLPIPRYSKKLPVQTMTFLNTEMSSFMYYFGGGLIDPPPALTVPDLLEEYFYYMNGRWKNGTPLTYGGSGFLSSSDTAKYAFPDSPTDSSGWSLYSFGASTADYRTISSTKRSEFRKNDVWKIDLAFTHHNDHTSNHIEMVDYALKQIPQLQQIYENSFVGCETLELCDCDCVWPGDTDNNGIVNSDDFINIMLAWGEMGTPRKGTLSWNGQSVKDWSKKHLDDVNYKYSDVDGDGRISLKDLDIIPDFLGRKNQCYQQDTVNKCILGNDLTWDRGIRKDSLLLSKRASWSPSLILNNKEPFLALSYEIKFDRSLFWFNVINDSLEWQNNLPGYANETNTNFASINIFQSNLDNSNQILKSDKLVKISLRTKHIPSYYPLPYTQIEVCNVKMHFADGSFKALGSQSLKYYFDDSVKIATKQILDGSRIFISPNPANNFVYIQTDFDNYNLIISNIAGIEIMNVNLNKKINTIDISELNSGIYIFTLRSDEEFISKKIMIERE